MNTKRRAALDKLEDVIEDYEDGITNKESYYFITTRDEVKETLTEIVDEINATLLEDERKEEDI